MKHLLHQVEADTRFALVLGYREVVEQVKVSHVGAVRVSVLVDQPFPFARVSVPRADVFGLKMLQLTVDIVSICHSCGDKTPRLQREKNKIVRTSYKYTEQLETRKKMYEEMIYVT